jgi:hypothetical protein
MRKNDADSSAARLCGVLHEMIKGNQYLALVPPPVPNRRGKIDWKEYSPGDAGVVLIDVTTGYVECVAGYLEGRSVRPLKLLD